MKKSPKVDCPKRFAHRGLVQYAPENTLEAFKAAVEYGCEAIELDIRRSKDGEVVVVHDKDFTRMTRGKVTDAIADMNLADIQAVDLPYAGHLLPYEPPVPYSEHEGSARTYTDEQVAEMEKTEHRIAHLSTFKEFDKWFETVDRDFIIEIEVCAPGVIVPLFEILWESKNCDRYIVFSGDVGHNKELQAYVKRFGKPEGLRLGANVRSLSPEIRAFIETADLYEVGLNDKRCTKEDVDWLRAKGILSFSNLGDYPEWWQSVSDFGFEGFKTNYAEAYTEWKLQQDNK